MRVVLGCPVWGERARRTFLTVSLPSQLAAMRGLKRDDTTYLLYTTDADAALIKQEPVYQKLLERCSVEFVYNPALTGMTRPWDGFLDCHRTHVKYADERDAAIIFISADHIWTPAAFNVAVQYLVEGASAVMHVSPRIREETAMPAFAAMVQDGELVVPGKVLAGMVFSPEHLQVETQCSTWNDPHFWQYCSVFYFPAKDGFVARGYNLTPVAIKPQVKNAKPEFLIFDQDWLAAACPDTRTYRYIENSDTLMSASLAPTNMTCRLPYEEDDAVQYRHIVEYYDPVEAHAWACEGIPRSPHRYFPYKEVLLHWGNANTVEWGAARAFSGRFVAAVDAIWGMSDNELLYLYPANFLKRLHHGHAIEGIGAREVAMQLVEMRRHRPVWKHP